MSWGNISVLAVEGRPQQNIGNSQSQLCHCTRGFGYNSSTTGAAHSAWPQYGNEYRRRRTIAHKRAIFRVDCPVVAIVGSGGKGGNEQQGVAERIRVDKGTVAVWCWVCSWRSIVTPSYRSTIPHRLSWPPRCQWRLRRTPDPTSRKSLFN